jgi:hypothetical protein
MHTVTRAPFYKIPVKTKNPSCGKNAPYGGFKAML